MTDPYHFLFSHAPLAGPSTSNFPGSQFVAAAAQISESFQTNGCSPLQQHTSHRMENGLPAKPAALSDPPAKAEELETNWGRRPESVQVKQEPQETAVNGHAGENGAEDVKPGVQQEVVNEVKLDMQPGATGSSEEQERKATPPASEPPDADSFLKFDTEEDRKMSMSPVKRESASRSRSASQSQSPDLKDEDDEDSKPKAEPGLPRSIAHLPVAEEEALSTFEEIDFSNYQNKSIGNSHQHEDCMICDCHFNPEKDDPDMACGSDCINRLTQVECVAGECRCKRYCKNQRFQRRQFAPIEIVQTELKGFGMRAKADIQRDEFIYEYVGDVINEQKFSKRMKDYFDEGIEHFYFMQLQAGEFIDATKRGGRSRFLNHSCAPNCYVAKWVVGRKLRMGIFAKRKIFKDEELTFNYNVDRYGHDAQVCHCGEPNCVGFIGGNTQTDIGGMDDLFLDALGISGDVEKLKLKGSKKRKSRKLDEDFIPDLKPIEINEVPKVAAAVRQASDNRLIITKLLERINLTEDQAVQRQVMRLHGFTAMNTVIAAFPEDAEVILAVLSAMSKWPLITRNKLVSTNIEPTVEELAKRADTAIAEAAKGLIEHWAELEMGYRIPRAMREAMESGDESKKREAEAAFEVFFKRARYDKEESKDGANGDEEGAKPAFVLPQAVTPVERPRRPKVEKQLPPNWQQIQRSNIGLAAIRPPSYLCTLTGSIYDTFPTPAVVAHEAEKHRRATLVNVNNVIAQAKAEMEARAAAEQAAEAKRIQDEASAKEAAEAEKKAKKEKKEAAIREKKMYALFSKIVVTTMSKYKKYFEADSFKRRAKEACQTICEKEKKQPSYLTETYDKVTPEKEYKIKKFVKEFTHKLLARKGIKPSSSSTHKSSDKSHRSHSSSHHRQTPSNGSASLPTPSTPSLTTSNQPNDDDDEMDVENEEDTGLLNELMQDYEDADKTQS